MRLPGHQTLVGGLSGVTLSGLKGAVPYLITGTLLALLLAADLNVLCLGNKVQLPWAAHRSSTLLGILAAALLAGQLSALQGCSALWGCWPRTLPAAGGQ